jgi:hypothetical protein
MAFENSTVRRVTEVILALVIVALAYVLYRTIRGPAERMERQQELTQQTRTRMLNVRKAMIRYEEQRDRYTTSLDSLVMFVKSDTTLQVSQDSLFGSNFQPDSLPFSPRTGNRFRLQVNDTSRVNTYKLTDPDRPKDYIGTTSGDVTQANAVSWR